MIWMSKATMGNFDMAMEGEIKLVVCSGTEGGREKEKPV